jgi:hypothetical protein
MSDMFDRLAKRLAKGVSRRDALKSFGGFLAGGFLAGLPGMARSMGGNSQLLAQCITTCSGSALCGGCPSTPSWVTQRCLEACKVYCVLNGGTVTTCGSCTATQPFVGCPTNISGVTCCSGTTSSGTTFNYCTNTNYDPRNCGSCGNVCTPPSGTTDRMGCCNGTCTDLSTDASNCGGCGRTCTEGTTPACCSGRCKDLATNLRNCGACGTVCTGTTPACCSGVCKDLSNDNNNCGACGNVCASGTTCTNGSCVSSSS